MAYDPNIFDPLNPTDAVDAETAQAEFRAIKTAAKFNIARSTTQLIVNNTTAPTDIVNLSVVGGLLSSNRIIKVNAKGTYRNITGSAVGISFDFKWGGNLIVNYTPIILSTADRGVFELDIELSGAGSTTQQWFYSKVVHGGAPNNLDKFAPDVVGSIARVLIEDMVSVDSSVTQTLAVTLTLPTATIFLNYHIDTALADYC